jgi:hypothetical protein
MFIELCFLGYGVKVRMQHKKTKFSFNRETFVIPIILVDAEAFFHPDQVADIKKKAMTTEAII